jgi:hypothetical protein
MSVSASPARATADWLKTSIPIPLSGLPNKILYSAWIADLWTAVRGAEPRAAWEQVITVACVGIGTAGQDDFRSDSATQIRPAYPACRSSSTPTGLADDRSRSSRSSSSRVSTRRAASGSRPPRRRAAATAPGTRRRRSAHPGSAPGAHATEAADEGRRLWTSGHPSSNVIHSDRNP